MNPSNSADCSLEHEKSSWEPKTFAAADAVPPPQRFTEVTAISIASCCVEESEKVEFGWIPLRWVSWIAVGAQGAAGPCCAYSCLDSEVRLR